jgi:pantoate--beta-alanine ligase
MRISKNLTEWRSRRAEISGHTIGVVPTMGALHPGHGSLVERCRRENDIVVATLFVNPTQFNDPADLAKYPRTLAADLELLEALGADDVFCPDTATLYPNGYAFRVVCDGLATVMEGRSRPGFFDGVMTVVLKLLNIVQADRAYFGEKDFQQWKVLHSMAADLFLPTEIIACPTIRTASGLAESSRNSLLTAVGRQKAAEIYRTLRFAPTAAAARQRLEAEGFRVDYVEEHWGRRFAAAFLEGVRLIDNVPLEEPECSSASM